MIKWLKLTDVNRNSGCYVRNTYVKDVTYKLYQYKQFALSYNKAAQRVYVKDGLVEQLLVDGLISDQEKECYEIRTEEALSPFEAYDECSLEEIYEKILGLRRVYLGKKALEEEQSLRAKRGVLYGTDQGIDQTLLKEELLQAKDAVLFVLCQTEWLSCMRDDILKAKAWGKAVYVVAHPEEGCDIPTKRWLECALEDCGDIQFLEMDGTFWGFHPERIAWDDNLQGQVERRNACLLMYGEEGFLQCRNLKLDAVVHGVPLCFHGKAVTNQLGITRACIAYIPAHFDITRWVKITERTRLTYWHLAKLWEDHGASIYELTPGQLYIRYPQYFLNIYENGRQSTAADCNYPIQLHWEAPFAWELEDSDRIMSRYDRLREEAIQAYLNGQPDVGYYAAYFDENLCRQRIPWECDGPKAGILVHGVRIKKADGARVINGKEGTSIRQWLSGEIEDGSGERPGFVSNFLFFLTPALVRLYNELRKDRKWEQIPMIKVHLDYMLYEKEGKRTETFPLFRKACIAKKRDGQFLFFNFRLGAGTVFAGTYPIRWDASCVDAGEDVLENGETTPVRVYTPYASTEDSNADRNTYGKTVGEGRINLVILQDHLICVRRGSVMLPGIGVVISLEETLGEALLKANGLTYLEDGYYETDIPLTIELDGPTEISEEEWKQVEWAYGGGLSLILDGSSLCDAEDKEQWFGVEGWMSPLSRQTQESDLHTMVKHPRTAIGVTWSGELVVLVFSGRTRISTGADYIEMCRIARQLIPEIRSLMNVDGGASAVLGMELNGCFMELSYPSSSMDNAVGMIRNINTVFYI